MTAKLYGRAWNITVGDTEINDLACEFTVKKTLKKEPNTCSLKIYNLNPKTRSKFTDPKAVMIRIEAGYGKKLSQLYLGEVRALSPGEVVGSDIVTELTSGDGEKKMQGTRLVVPIGAGSDSGVALRAIAKALGVGPGNTEKTAARMASTGVAYFARSTVISGNAARALTDLCRSAGLEWSIQDGQLQLLDVNKWLDIKPYVISSSSGMVGGPKLASDGKVQVETLMIPDLRPGMRIQIESLTVNGLYRIIESNYSGQTHGAGWGIRHVCEAPKKAA